MGRSVGHMASDRSSSYRRAAFHSSRIPVTDLCTSGQILARIEHPVSGKQYVFRHCASSTRDDVWRMYEVVDFNTDGMKCRRAWCTEDELQRTLMHYLAHGFVDVTTFGDRMFSSFTERTAPHVAARLEQRFSLPPGSVR